MYHGGTRIRRLNSTQSTHKTQLTLITVHERMHGRKRSAREELDPPEVRAAKADKYKQYLQGCKLALSSEQAAAKAEKLLRYNPDFLTLWNARRRAILRDLDRPGGEDLDHQTRKVMLETELALTKEQISERNSKSYGAWFHRRWAIETIGRVGGEIICDLNAELVLCDQLLLRDERNFHCWAHRHVIAHLAQVSAEETLNKSSALIEKNFSNYSAWHLRVQALSRLLVGEGKEYDWNKEFDLVHQAVFTEPADQSAWLYFRWLLTKDAALGGSGEGRIRDEIDVVLSLLDEEGDCKWPLLALLQLYSKLPFSEDTKAIALDVCERIQRVDAGHVRFYEFVASLFDKGDTAKLHKTLFCSV